MKIKVYNTILTQIELFPRITIVYANGVGLEWLWFGLFINIKNKNQVGTPREFADKIWGTQGFDDNDLRDFNINLNTAIGMIETYCKKKDEAINKASEVFQQYFDDGGKFYGNGIYEAIEKLNEAKNI